MATPDVHDDYPANQQFPVQLERQNFAIIGGKMYAKYPIPMTFCSEHTKAVRSMRNINNIVMHVCGKDHRNELDSKMDIVNICGLCKAQPRNITAHMRNLHEVDIIDITLKPVDMRDISESKQPIWKSYYGCADLPWC